MIKIVTDTSALKQSIPTTTFTKEEQDLATAALLTAVTEHKGLGMSANQIGLNKRICVINVREEPLVLVNPTIVEETEEKIMYFEGCLSLPKTMKKPIKTVRSYGVKVKADNFPDVLDFSTKERKHEDINALFGDVDLLESVCVQHEIDHLNGLTIRDRQYTETVRLTAYAKLGRNQRFILKKGDETLSVKKKNLSTYLEQGWEVA
jgi:peptide deformylase